MKLTLGFSPCPNDTFIFDALVNNKIDTEGLEFDIVLEDVQTLNQWAIEDKLDITKLSYGVLPLVLDKYIVLNSGSALGRGVGPLLIKNERSTIKNIEDNLIAVPGKNTTAHLLFSLAFPTATNKIFLRYDEIENFVKDNKGLGVIIHENRFTYADKGLEKIIDLGDYWENETSNPIPLGGIVISRNIDISIQKKVDVLIRKSIEYAFSNYPTLTDFIRRHSQEMSEDVMRKHIDLYVNNYSISLGEDGKKAIEKLLSVYQQTNQIKGKYINIFLN
ncbi:1,4-dihydroxy-6-naphthoate synthase [Ferruginibacter lapsinanis]|uniref:1,4-dihydroxy-6-naphthoate synthase n=1 Tax=Ferruginibacter lapsinanis TaxID=563172 RepID=UPI001E3EADC5|nr:1,4-dihydroxy-6-naphthoate synthase [Ferruginibacter lapsinanis]UEG48946.1 1,4-dihydroxy-6-naphthoate synthase [Ferruginibacter lapsinanis]